MLAFYHAPLSFLFTIAVAMLHTKPRPQDAWSFLQVKMLAERHVIKVTESVSFLHGQRKLRVLAFGIAMCTRQKVTFQKVTVHMNSRFDTLPFVY